MIFETNPHLDPNPAGAPAVLLIHGLGSRGSSWLYQLEALARAGMRPIAPDLPGFGDAALPPGRWRIREVARQLDALMTEKGVTRFAVVGLSLGGAVAQELAALRPERVERLALVSTFACLRPHSVDEWLHLLRRFFKAQVIGPEAQAADVANRTFPRPEQVWLRKQLIADLLRADRTVYQQAMIEIIRFDFRPRAGQLRLPMLILTGAQDATVSPQVQQEMARCYPHARHLVIDGGGHGVIVEQVQAVNQALLEFLRG